MKDSREAVVERLPKCDFCNECARYDAPTVNGPWANMCFLDWMLYRKFDSLGLGKGQNLILEDEQ